MFYLEIRILSSARAIIDRGEYDYPSESEAQIAYKGAMDACKLVSRITTRTLQVKLCKAKMISTYKTQSSCIKLSEFTKGKSKELI